MSRALPDLAADFRQKLVELEGSIWELNRQISEQHHRLKRLEKQRTLCLDGIKLFDHATKLHQGVREEIDAHSQGT